MTDGIRVDLTVNERSVSVAVAADRTLLSVLRDDLELTGTKDGCGMGICGACSVLVDGRLVSSCLVLAASIDGSTVTTIEGLATDELTSLQRAFITHGGLQCGICTPGQVMAATALLDEQENPSPDQIRHWMAGNLCRCTGYAGIVDAILAVADISSAERPSGASAHDVGFAR
jgi:aerobic-type carbon monoxide dehydrogenase small subunit (CoxS/CutS family)